MTHTICPDLLRRTVRVLVVGCGGTGSAVAGGLPYLHQALVACGHPGGLHVTLMDGDIVSRTNCVRQPFSESDIGLYKAVVLISRINVFWGLNWDGVPEHLPKNRPIQRADVVIGCVDTRAARSVIAANTAGWQSSVAYWLDIGNNADSGQFILGQPQNGRNRRKAERLRTAAELFRQIIDPSLDDDGLPSCSAVEALERQEPFVNQTLANHALALLARLFGYGTTSYHGGFVNLATGGCSALPVDPRCWKRIRMRKRRRSSRG